MGVSCWWDSYGMTKWADKLGGTSTGSVYERCGMTNWV